MKIIQFSMLISFLITFSICFSQNPAKEIKTEIKEVTLFSQGAQVYRSTTLNIPEGESVWKFTRLSSELDPSSIQVKGEGNFTIVSVSHMINYLENQIKSDSVTLMLKEQDALAKRIDHLKTLHRVLQAELQLLENNQSIGGENNGLKTEELIAAMNFHRSRRLAALKEMDSIRYEQDSLSVLAQKYAQQLQNLRAEKDKPSSEIIVKLDAPRKTKATVRLNYLINKAGWFASYNIRADEVGEPISLEYKANVYQYSGIDWKEVKLSLSSGNPREGGTKPTIEPWYLGYINPNAVKSTSYIQQQKPGVLGGGGPKVISGIVKDSQGAPLAGASIIANGTTIGTLTKGNGSFVLELPPGVGSFTVNFIGYETQELAAGEGSYQITMQDAELELDEVVVTAYAEQKSNSLQGRVAGVQIDQRRRRDQPKPKAATIPLSVTTDYQSTTFSFELEKAYTLLSDGKTQQVNLKEEEVEANYEYYAAPKLDPDAFLTAEITDWEKLNLLKGEANLYFEGTYLGKTLINPTAFSDTLILSLGRDKGIQIKRERIRDFTQKKFLANQVEELVGWEIKVKNNKGQAISLKLEDQFPISTYKEIQLSKLTYDGAQLDKEQMLISWEIQLEAGENTTNRMSYEVKYPKGRKLNLD